MTHAPQCSSQHYLQYPRHGSNLSVHQQMNKEDVIHIYNGILLSHKKEWNNVICSNMMDPEIIILSEVSQKEKDKCMKSLICGI